MLYERWRQIAGAWPDGVALREAGSGRQWTFRELDVAAGQGVIDGGKVAYPRGIAAEFILTVLRAWRTGQVVCPLEPGQAEPALREPLPDGIVHLKTTSASTGDPRIIAFTAAQLIADAENIVATMGLRPDWP